MSVKHLTGQRIVVTGASGFIGSRLCRKLLENGNEVHGIYYNSEKSKLIPNVIWWKCDVSKFNETKELLLKINPDYIFHLASYVQGSRNIDLILPTFKYNLESTINILVTTKELNCKKIVLSGSMEELDESDLKRIPSSPYAAAKEASTSYAKMFHALYQIPVVIARIFMVYGPEQKDIKKLVPYTILSLKQNKALQFTSGSRNIDWIYVDDVISGLLTIAKTPNLNGEIIDLGTGKLALVKDIVRKLIKIQKSDITPKFGDLPDRVFENTKVANVQGTESKINWKPKISLDEGLELTTKWYLENYD